MHLPGLRARRRRLPSPLLPLQCVSALLVNCSSNNGAVDATAPALFGAPVCAASGLACAGGRIAPHCAAPAATCLHRRAPQRPDYIVSRKSRTAHFPSHAASPRAGRLLASSRRLYLPTSAHPVSRCSLLQSSDWLVCEDAAAACAQRRSRSGRPACSVSRRDGQSRSFQLAARLCSDTNTSTPWQQRPLGATVCPSAIGRDAACVSATGTAADTLPVAAGRHCQCLAS
jgi:hypothetical protein